MSVTPKISILSDQVINKIAAGEVVERPASVVKELVENAIDAKSDRIFVQIKRGGRESIVISDNGHGMTSQQAKLSLKRYATSKIKSEDDIEQITSLGFRGEALAAIASVSRLTLTTRSVYHDEGYYIKIEYGKTVESGPIGCPTGTSIEVSDLFYNVPARRKFLRAEQTEISHIKKTILTQALAKPAVAIKLHIDERKIHSLNSTTILSDRICALYQPAFLKQLVPINFKDKDISITGYIGLPQTARKDRADQFIFVNNRPAIAPVLHHALNECYHPLFGRGLFPAIFLFIQIDPRSIDVNVHPAKKEIRFKYPNKLRDTLIKAINKALLGVNDFSKKSTKISAQGQTLSTPKISKQKNLDRILDESRNKKIESQKLSNYEVNNTENLKDNKKNEAPWGWYRLVGQINDKYIILETQDGYALIEPQSAHERILYEKFMKAVKLKQALKQQLLTPETIEPSAMDADHVRQAIPLLNELGFDIAEFGGDSFVIDALPIWAGQQPINSLIINAARAVVESGKQAAIRESLAENVIRIACAGAVRSKAQLTSDKMDKLILELSETEMPYISPRGKPTVLFKSYTELDGFFKRNK